ncbi:MAG: hypothetical protein JXA41_04040 [Deltaproteobacteria bacterium]|nr:hypothetical protein [Deltaproteobacteria bacterium]
MKYLKSFLKYLQQTSAVQQRPLMANSLENIDQVVVIPCFAESRYLFKTLYSLVCNPAADLLRTLILCVVNNGSPQKTRPNDLKDNQLTLNGLSMLITGRAQKDLTQLFDFPELFQRILKTKIRLSCIDASSAGFELPDHECGVGTARKIGLDAALGLLDSQKDFPLLLYCLDADTIVENNYLSSVRNFFESRKTTAAYVSFAHQDAEDDSMQQAILCYEIFLRYYVTGLYYARSPYAFHTVGSTIICTADGYAAVRGMNKRRAGEDFYFLNKLAKLDGIACIKSTTVYPSSRTSQRVPFGTGQGMLKVNREGKDNYLVYHPDVFAILMKWLEHVEHEEHKNVESLMKAANAIHPLLESFLQLKKFPEKWRRMSSNNHDPIELKRQFHQWLDGFKTLKLIHYLSQNGIAAINMFDAVDQMLNMLNIHFPMTYDQNNLLQREEQRRLLNFLRTEIPV